MNLRTIFVTGLFCLMVSGSLFASLEFIENQMGSLVVSRVAACNPNLLDLLLNGKRESSHHKKKRCCKRGPRGSQGPTGPAGAVGPVGPVGSTGPAGSFTTAFGNFYINHLLCETSEVIVSPGGIIPFSSVEVSTANIHNNNGNFTFDTPGVYFVTYGVTSCVAPVEPSIALYVNLPGVGDLLVNSSKIQLITIGSFPVGASAMVTICFAGPNGDTLSLRNTSASDIILGSITTSDNVVAYMNIIRLGDASCL